MCCSSTAPRYECARSCETVKRGGASSLNDVLANLAGYGSYANYQWSRSNRPRIE